MSQENEPATKKDLEELNQDLSAKIEVNAVKIDANAAKIDANSAKIDDVERRLSAKIDANAGKIEENGRKIDANSTALSRVTQRVVENSEKIDQLLTMSGKFNEYFDDIINTLDGLAAGFARLDQERVAANAKFERIEKDVDRNKTDIKKIKTKLAMP